MSVRHSSTLTLLGSAVKPAAMRIITFLISTYALSSGQFALQSSTQEYALGKLRKPLSMCLWGDLTCHGVHNLVLSDKNQYEKSRSLRYYSKGWESTARKEMQEEVWTVVFDTLDAYVEYRNDGLNETLKGFIVDLWRIVEDFLGFKSVFQRVDSGLVARLRLRQGLADVYLAPVVIEMEDLKHYVGTQPVVMHWYHLFVMAGPPQVSTDSYVRALSKTMWLLSAVALVLMATALHCFVRVRTGASMGRGMLEQDTSLGACFLSVLGGVCLQGSQFRPTCLSVRSLLITAFWFGYLLCNAYQSVLVSHFAVGRLQLPFSSLSDFAAKNTHRLCVRNSSFAFSYIQANPELRRITNIGVCAGVSRPEHLVAAVCRREGLAALEIPSVMGAALRGYPAYALQLQRLKTGLLRSAASLLLRRGFAHKKALDLVVMRCREAGILDFLGRKYFASVDRESSSIFASEDNGKERPGFIHVSLDHIQFVVVTYCIMLLFPLCVLAGELAAWRWAGRTRPRPTAAPARPEFRI